MISLDVFHQSPFTAIEMTEAVNKVPYLPIGLGELNLFTPYPIMTQDLMIEEKQNQLTLIPRAARGAPYQERTQPLRSAKYFKAPRLPTSATIQAAELNSVRAMGQEAELETLANLVAERVSGPTGILSDLEYTLEYHRLGAIQGILLDSSGATINNWFTEFGISQPALIAFNLAAGAGASPTAGVLRPICNGIVRTMARAAQGAFTASTEVYALCGDEFWDGLTNHIDVRQTFYNWAAAAELRKGNAFEAMKFGGINWFNYRGSDDTTSVAIPTNQAQFFPKGARDIFSVAYAPHDSFEFVNKRGKKLYLRPITDRERNSFVRFELDSYPLHICKRPEVLLRAEA